MARTVDQIQESIKSDFVANTTLRDAYSLDSSKTFDEQFSKVAIESILIYIFSMATFILEKTMDSFRSAVDAKIASSYVASLPWYWQKVLEYQHGDAIEYLPSTYSFGYGLIDESKRIIKYAAVREVSDLTSCIIHILVAGAEKKAITSDQLTALTAYIQRIGAAGTKFDIQTDDAQQVGFKLSIVYDPVVLDTSGQLLKTPDSYPVNDAISAYLNNLEYGGVMSSTKLIDTICNVQGVVEADYIATVVNGADVTDLRVPATSGSFTYESDLGLINYTPLIA